MAKNAITNQLTKRQKICTYTVICTLSLLGGVEYAVILPTLYLHLRDTYQAPSFYLGLVISAYSFSGLFAGPIIGRFYDKTRRSKLLISLTNIFEFCGSVMYWFGLSPLFLVASRLVAGLGNGYFPVVLAEVSHGTSNEARTSVVSAIMGVRQIGLLLGPGFNLFLRKLNFYIGPFIVDKYSSPGIFLALLWIISQLLVTFLYYPLTTLVTVPDNPPTQNGTNINSDTQPTHNGVNIDSDPQPTHNGVNINSDPQPTHNGVNINSDPQPTQPIDTTDTESHSTLPIDISEPVSHTTQYANNNGPEPTSKPVVITEVNTSTALQGTTIQHRSMKQVVLDITYEEYMTIYMLTFVALFNQTGMETIVTPVCAGFLGWTELEISIMFCLAGVLILVSFFMVHVFSKKYQDRTLIMFGLFCEIVTLAWFLYWIPTFTPNVSADYTKNTIILIPGLVFNVFGLPFIFVCHISLFSKLLSKEIQGVGHGIRRVLGGIAAILGPLWSSSLLEHYYMLYGVMLGLNLIAFLLLALSFKKLTVPVTSQSEDVRNASTSADGEINEKTPLINA